MSKSEDSHELTSFEAKLSTLVPRADRLDRERLAFLAGQASVTANRNQSLLNIGGWQRHPAWPAAFAGMSALAATLLILMVTRPVTREFSDSGFGDIATADRSHASSRNVVNTWPERLPDTLSARDALSGDIEQRMTRLSKKISAPLFSIERPESPSLTPAAWRRVSDDSRSPVPSAGSSSPPVIWRAST